MSYPVYLVGRQDVRTVAGLTQTHYNDGMTKTDIKHKRRKQAWESLTTPRVSWEDFKRIAAGSSSLEQAKTVARFAMLKSLKKNSK